MSKLKEKTAPFARVDMQCLSQEFARIDLRNSDALGPIARTNPDLTCARLHESACKKANAYSWCRFVDPL